MWQRVGLVPSTEHEDTQHLHRSAVVVSRASSTLGARYGRAALGTLAQAAGHVRLAQVGAVVIWGGDDKAVAQEMKRARAATMIVVLKAKPKKASAVVAMAQRLAGRNHRVEIYVIGTKAKVIAVDVGPGQAVQAVTDLRRPPQGQVAPSTPRKPVAPWVHRAPSAPSSSERGNG